RILSYLFLLLITLKLTAQETTATISGTVYDDKGTIVPGASVLVKHEPTGFATGTTSNAKGIFVIPNLNPGGPYTITISFFGFKEQKLENINLSLGNNPDANIVMASNDKSLQEVVISGTRRAASSGLNISRGQLNVLPTLGRSLSDFTRLTPQSNNNSFAGT